ncbi:MAG: permease prefix domain 1-containing protein [Gammaproteobacteria bacterium]|nr:permease prefix domain 1-containing protein [Gammaproteobacteria bacterium]
MTDIETKVNDWCEQLFVDRCWYRNEDRMEELKDHLLSEIERLQEQQGMDAESAFARATASMGSVRDLEREFSKNRGWLGRLSRNIAMSECGVTKKERKMRLANSFIWAALMIASALVFKSIDADVSDAFGYLLVLVYVPLCLASDQLIRKAVRKSEA